MTGGLPIDLILFGMVAAFLVLRLRSVLGRRTGFERPTAPAVPPTAREELPAPAQPGAPARALPDPRSPLGQALLRIRGVDQAFEPAAFLNGAEGAFRMIVQAFAAGDRETLKNLLAPNVMASFESAIADRETRGVSETVEFLHPPRADLERADLRGDMASVTVRFLAEFRSRTKSSEGEAVDDKRTAELWTFERSVKSRDPNWTLVHVDAAEA